VNGCPDFLQLFLVLFREYAMYSSIEVKRSYCFHEWPFLVMCLPGNAGKITFTAAKQKLSRWFVADIG